MVGVGGRSKGCHTCKRRRVKCDETHPICTRCTRAKVKCEGYARETLFVDQRARAARPPKLRRDESSSSSSGASTPSSFSGVEDAISTISLLDSVENATLPACQNETAPLHDGSPVVWCDMSILGYQAFEDTIQQAFIMAHFFNGLSEIFPPLTKVFESRLLTDEPAITGIRKYCFGRIYGQPATMSEGLKSYANALVSLRDDIQDPVMSRSMDVMVTSNLLTIFEFMASHDMFDWMKHMEGMGYLIKNGGPHRFATPTGRAILEMGRFGIAIVHMVKGRRCFLEEKLWKTIPWTTDPEPRDNLNRITDVLVHLGGLREDVAKLTYAYRSGLCSPTIIEANQAAISIKIRDLLTELFMARIDWDIDRPFASFEVSSGPHESNSRPLFEMDIHFESLKRGNEVLMYDSTLLMLLGESNRTLGSARTQELRREALASAVAQVHAQQSKLERNAAAWHESTSNNLPDTGPLPTAFNTQLGATIAVPITNPALRHPTECPSPESIVIELARIMPYHLLPNHSFQTNFLMSYGLRVIYLFYQRIWIQPATATGTEGNNADTDEAILEDSGDGFDATDGDAWTKDAVNHWLAGVGAQMANMSGFGAFRGLFFGLMNKTAAG